MASTHEAPSACELIFSCSVCHATIGEIYKIPESNQGISNTNGFTIVTKLWLTECAHLTCVEHLNGGGAYSLSLSTNVSFNLLQSLQTIFNTFLLLQQCHFTLQTRIQEPLVQNVQSKMAIRDRRGCLESTVLSLGTMTRIFQMNGLRHLQ
jgi:hypothetical protein